MPSVVRARRAFRVRRVFRARTGVLAGTLAGTLLLSGAPPAGAAPRAPNDRTVAVGGDVSMPATYTRRALAGLPQTTVTVGWPAAPRDRRHTDTGVSLDALVTSARPVLPDTKNARLRVVVTVTGTTGRRTFAVGELDPDFGAHDAVLALTQDGHALRTPDLVVPGDTTSLRFVSDVHSITVGVENPTPTTPVSPGALELHAAGRTVNLTVAQLAALPAETLGVSFIAGSGSQSHTETGPTLATVLETSGFPTGRNTWVAAVGSDGYVAVATPDEATTGGRPLIISLFEDGAALPQPRLVTDGDLKGGRYVSLLVDLVVGRISPSAP